MTTTTSTEMNGISNIMIANTHFTREGLRELVDQYNNSELSLALDCVYEEGTIDTILKFFTDNLDYYPEALEQNTGMDMYTYPSELVVNTSRTNELREFYINGVYV